MAIIKPILDNVYAFDASEGTTITFSCVNQIFGSKITIYDPDSKNIIVDLDSVSNMNSFYEIPPNTGLVNGKQYEMILTVYEDHLFSEINSYQSDSKLFYCFTRPEFLISPITTTNDYYIIKNPSLSLDIIYEQKENEFDNSLNIYYIKFYDDEKREISNSGELYGINGTKQIFSVSGLNNKTFYYFRAFGTTKYGMELDTGFSKVFTSFIKYESSSNLKLENHYCEGEITGEVYMNAILYRSDKPVEFENDTVANLKDNRLEYYSGLRIGDNFSMFTKLQDINPDSCFLKLVDAYGTTINFYYCTYKKYNDKNLHNTNNFPSNEYDKAVIEYIPYFSIVIGNQRYLTSYFSSAFSLTELSEKSYSIAFSKHRDIINFKINELIT